MLNSDDSDAFSTLNTPIWMQQENESNGKYSLFLTFLGLPLPRTYKALMEQTRYAEQTLKGYAKEFNWKNRAAAYDADQLEKTQVTKRETLGYLKEHIVKQEFEDARLMLDKWRSMLQAMTADDKPADLLRMVQARSRIDTMLRVAAELPTNYLPIPTATPEEPEDWELTLPDASKTSATPSLPSQNQGTSGTIQGAGLWSEMGEEFSGEE